MLLHALSIVVQKEQDVVLLFIGGGSGLSKLRDLVKQLKLNNHVIFAGWIPHHYLPAIIRLSAISIGQLLPTRDNKGAIPKKVLEALACGVPVIALKDTVSKDLLIDGYNGLVISKPSAEILAEKIIYLLTDQTLRKTLGDNARGHVLTFFSDDNFEQLVRKIKEFKLNGRRLNDSLNY